MADSAVFEFVASELEQRSSLDRLEARGTLRLALKEAGLDGAGVTAAQMAIVLQKVLPGELAARGVDDPAGTCAALGARLSGLRQGAATRETPEAVFARLGGS